MLGFKQPYSKKLFGLFVIAIFFTISVPFAYVAYAAGVPSVFSYQGRLTDTGGNPLGGNGTQYYFKFSLWDAATVGSGSKVWPAGSPGTYPYTIKNGYFNVNIGDTDNGYPDALDFDFNSAQKVYLQVEVSSDNTNFEPLSPRTLVTASAFSKVAGQVNGTADSSFGTTTPFANTLISALSTSVNKAVLTLKGIAGQVANLFNIQDSNGNSLFAVGANGNVGVGTASPSSKFSVVGDTSLTGNLNVTGTTTTSNLTATNFIFGNSTFTSLLGAGLTNISGSLSVATTSIQNMFSSSASGLSYAPSTGIFSLTSGYNIPLTASSTDWNTAFVNRITSASSPLSISGNVISIQDASADGSTKGAATFNSTNFSASSGVVNTIQNINTSATPTFASTTLSNFTAGSIPFFGTGGALSQNNSNLFWDNANRRLGIGTTTPGSLLTVAGPATFDTASVTNGLTLGTSGILVGGTNTIDQRNGTNAQKFRLYQSYTDASNYAALGISYAAGVGYQFKQEKAGSGGAADIVFDGGGNSIMISRSGVDNFWKFTSAGSFIAPTDNTYDIGASGATRPRSIYIGSNGTFGGTVGIGTTTPASKLAVLSTTEQLRLNYDASNYSKFTVGSASGLTLTPGMDGTSAFNFTKADGSTSIFNIDSTNGRVGIGTVSPVYKLQVEGALYLNAPLSNTVAASGQSLLGPQGYWGIREGTNNSYNIDVYNSNNWLTPMTIIQTGNVGIGTTTPSTKLQVYGTAGTDIFDVASSTGTSILHITQAGNVGIGTTSPTAKLQIETTVGGTDALILRDTTNNANARFYFSSPLGAPADLNISAGRFIVNGRLRLTAITEFSTGGNLVGLSSGDITLNPSNNKGIIINAAASANTTFSVGALNVAPTGSNLPGLVLYSGAAEGLTAGDIMQWRTGTTTATIAGVINSLGSLGIGTSTPSAKLDLYGTAGSSDIFAVSSSTNSRLFTVAASGNVGIGTASPTALLEVSGAGKFTSLSTASLASNGNYMTMSSNRAWTFNIATAADGNSGNAFILNYQGVDLLHALPASNYLGIHNGNPQYQLDVGGTFNVSATSTFAGNVGIGTTTPGALLTVAGAITSGTAFGINATSTFAGNLFDMKTGGTSKLTLSSLGDLSGPSGANFSYGGAIIGNKVVLGNLGITTYGGLIGINGDNRSPYETNSIAFSRTATTSMALKAYTTSGSVGADTASLALNAISLSGTINVTGTSTLMGNVGIGTTTPSAQLDTTGTVRFEALTGAGANLVVDANGNVTVSSDERLKNIQGNFNRGLSDVMNLKPIIFKWKPETGYDASSTYAGFSAQNVQLAIPEAVGTDSRGYLTLADRPILATVVNAIKSIGSVFTKIENGVAWVTTIFADKVTTKELCVGDSTDSVCVTKDQLRLLLQNANASLSTNSNSLQTQTQNTVTESADANTSSVNTASTTSPTSDSTSTNLISGDVNVVPTPPPPQSEENPAVQSTP